MLSDIERARRAFLLTVCERGGDVEVARHYVAEKVEAIYRRREPSEIRALLDLEGQRVFDRILQEPV